MTHGRPNFDDLAALASGELTAAEANALESAALAHPDLAATLGRLRTIVSTLRTDDGCPPPTQAVARVKATLARLVERHLAGAATGTSALGTRWWEGLLDAVARLVFDSADPVLAAGFRSLGELAGTRQVAFERDGIELDLQFEPGTFDGQSARCQVMGQVADAVGEGDCSGLNVAVIAASDGAVVETTTDATGVFVLSLEPGVHDFVIGGPKPMALRGIRVP